VTLDLGGRSEGVGRRLERATACTKALRSANRNAITEVSVDIPSSGIFRVVGPCRGPTLIKPAVRSCLTRNIPASQLSLRCRRASLFRQLESGAKTCVLPAIAVAINQRPLAPVQAAYPNVRCRRCAADLPRLALIFRVLGQARIGQALVAMPRHKLIEQEIKLRGPLNHWKALASATLSARRLVHSINGPSPMQSQ
jgi:hypothetical protein